MSETATILPGEQRPMVWMYMPPDGTPMPCLADKVAYARGLGYEECNPPDAERKPVSDVIPEETAADHEERVARELEERQAAVAEQLAAIGVVRPPNIGCADCGGSGLCPKGAVAPCWTCYPEAREAAEAAAKGPNLEDDSPTLGGSDNGDVIDGLPADTTTITVTGTGFEPTNTVKLDTTTPRSCNMAGCKGLCGICPPPKKVTVRAGRELNKNRRALGLDPLKIVDGVVKGGA